MWIKIDDKYSEHPKFAAAGPLGHALWLAGLAYCNRNLTDGFIPWSIARSLLCWEFLEPAKESGQPRIMTIGVTSSGHAKDVSSSYVIDLLCSAGLWEEAPGGYRIHDYLEYQPSREQISADREALSEKRSIAGRLGGRASGEARSKREANKEANAKQTMEQNPSPDPVPDPVPDPGSPIPLPPALPPSSGSLPPQQASERAPDPSTTGPQNHGPDPEAASRPRPRWLQPKSAPEPAPRPEPVPSDREVAARERLAEILRRGPPKASAGSTDADPASRPAVGPSAAEARIGDRIFDPFPSAPSTPKSDEFAGWAKPDDVIEAWNRHPDRPPGLRVLGFFAPVPEHVLALGATAFEAIGRYFRGCRDGSEEYGPAAGNWPKFCTHIDEIAQWILNPALAEPGMGRPLRPELRRGRRGPPESAPMPTEIQPLRLVSAGGSTIDALPSDVR